MRCRRSYRKRYNDAAGEPQREEGRASRKYSQADLVSDNFPRSIHFSARRRLLLRELSRVIAPRVRANVLMTDLSRWKSPSFSSNSSDGLINRRAEFILRRTGPVFWFLSETEKRFVFFFPYFLVCIRFFSPHIFRVNSRKPRPDHSLITIAGHKSVWRA